MNRADAICYAGQLSGLVFVLVLICINIFVIIFGLAPLVMESDLSRRSFKRIITYHVRALLKIACLAIEINQRHVDIIDQVECGVTACDTFIPCVGYFTSLA